jgi:hypothetical protein
MLTHGQVKVGEEIECIDADTRRGELTLGATYTILELMDDYYSPRVEWVMVECDTGFSYWYYPHHFKKIVEPEVGELWQTI